METQSNGATGGGRKHKISLRMAQNSVKGKTSKTEIQIAIQGAV